MKLIVIGCGRVGSTIAKRFAGEGWDVTAVDEKESALSRLGENWAGGFVVGHGMDVAVLREAGIEEADAVGYEGDERYDAQPDLVRARNLPSLKAERWVNSPPLTPDPKNLH